MAQNFPLLLRLVGSSVTAANRAGRIIKDVMNKGDLGIKEKAKNDLQTEADRSAQNCIIASLSKLYKNITIIGEEGVSKISDVPDENIANYPDPKVLEQVCPEVFLNLKEEEIVVWVDPLDGTAEYTQGLVEHVTVLIGIAVGSESVAGVIHQPYYKHGGIEGRTIWGIKGVGVGGFEPSLPPEGKFVVTTTRSHSNQLVESALEALKPDEVLRVGGAGYKVLLLMEGKAHAYVFPTPGCKRWDTCAPEAVLAALGGKLTDMKGQIYNYDKNTEYSNKEGVLAAYNEVYHQRCLETLSAKPKTPPQIN